MLAASGGTEADRTKPEKGGACRCWASPRGCWSYIQKVNRVSVSVLDTYGNDGAPFSRTMPLDKLSGLMSAAEVEAKRVAGLLIEAANGTDFFLAPPPPAPSPIQPTAEETKPDSDPERSLRALWTAEGVSAERQDELIASVTAKAQPGAMVSPFRIGERIEAMRGTLKAGVAVVTASSSSLPGQARRAYGRACAHRSRPAGSGARAFSLLNPGGRMVALCANGPRQQKRLKPLVQQRGGPWKEELPADTFSTAGTNVRTILLAITG